MFDLIKTTIRLQEETKNAIDDIAKIECRSFNQQVEYILQMYIIEFMKNEEKKGKS